MFKTTTAVSVHLGAESTLEGTSVVRELDTGPYTRTVINLDGFELTFFAGPEATTKLAEMLTKLAEQLTENAKQLGEGALVLGD